MLRIGPARRLAQLPERDAVRRARRRSRAAPRRRAPRPARDVGHQRQALVAGGQGDLGGQAGRPGRPARPRCASAPAPPAAGRRRCARRRCRSGRRPRRSRLTVGRKPRRARLGLQRQRDDAGIVLQPHADARVVVARRIAVVDGDRGRDRRRLSVPLVSGTEISVARDRRGRGSRCPGPTLHDQQRAGAARQRQRRRERQPLRAGRRSCAACARDRGGPGRLRQVQEHQLVRVLDEGLAAARSGVDDHPALLDRIDREAAERIGQRRQLVALRG